MMEHASLIPRHVHASTIIPSLVTLQVEGFPCPKANTDLVSKRKRENRLSMYIIEIFPFKSPIKGEWGRVEEKRKHLVSANHIKKDFLGGNREA